jgi:hypothetical protein
MERSNQGVNELQLEEREEGNESTDKKTKKVERLK